MRQATPRPWLGRSLDERFWGNVNKTDSCWIWTGSKTSEGYGNFNPRNCPETAHRISFMLFNGEIPKNMVVDHICRNRLCVNPTHMRLLNRGENVLAGLSISGNNKRKSLCPNGHKYDGIKKNGNRFCNKCTLANRRKWYEETKSIRNKKRREAWAKKSIQKAGAL